MSIRKVIRKARGKSYEYFAVRYTDPGTGKPGIKYFPSMREAKAAEPTLRTSIKHGTFNPESDSVTVGEIVKLWRAAAYAPRKCETVRPTTAESYELALRRILARWGAVRMNSIRASHLEMWRGELETGGAGASTVRSCLLVLGILFRFAMRDHYVVANPASLVRKPSTGTRRHETLTAEQVAHLFTVTSGRTRIVIRLAAGTGMRQGEIFGLTWGDVDLAAARITVRQQYTHGAVGPVKTDAGRRVVGIDGKLAAELKAWKLAQEPERKAADSFVIATETGGPLSASNFLNREFRKALKDAGLPRLTFHSLRHTAATLLVSSAMAPGAVHRVLGHSNLATTMKLYGDITEDARSEAADVLGASFEPADKRRTNRSVRVEGTHARH